QCAYLPRPIKEDHYPQMECATTREKNMLSFRLSKALWMSPMFLIPGETKKICCEWSGITCNNQIGNVVALNLYFDVDDPFDSYAPLRGEIGPSLLELEYLDYMDLSNNDFRGRVTPNFTGSLSKLKATQTCKC
ncbi:unnamed protein product, partial [Prunus brigantina]